MSRYVLCLDAAVRLADEQHRLSPDNQLLAPTLLRSQVLARLYSDVRHGARTRHDAEQTLDYLRRLRVRFLGDRVLQDRAWRLAEQQGWANTYNAEYVALTQLQADALVTDDPDLAAAVTDLVTVASVEMLS